MNALTEAFREADARSASKPPRKPRQSQVGHAHIKWTEAEWMTVAGALMRLFPDLGLPAPEGVARIKLKHMKQAMRALPANRQRALVQVVSVREHFLKTLPLMATELGTPKRPTPAPVTTPAPVVSLALPASVVNRQPDGADDGPPPSGSRVYWRESEWYKIAAELAYQDPAFLDSLNNCRASDIFRAQRVLPTSRRKVLSSLYGKHVRAELAPAFRSIRLAVEAARKEQGKADAAAANEQAARDEQARAAEREAERQTMLDQLAQSPEFTARALGGAEFAPLLDALMTRAAASLQNVLEAAIIGALSSGAVKNALVVNLHMTSGETSAKSVAANPPRISGDAQSNVLVKPKIGIVGALAQQGEILADAYPQLRIKAIDKNLSGQSLREAVANCDRVIGMTNFLSHSMDAVCHKAAGERYTRVDGGVSSVRRMIDIWLSTGALGAAVVAST